MERASCSTLWEPLSSLAGYYFTLNAPPGIHSAGASSDWDFFLYEHCSQWLTEEFDFASDMLCNGEEQEKVLDSASVAVYRDVLSSLIEGRYGPPNFYFSVEEHLFSEGDGVPLRWRKSLLSSACCFVESIQDVITRSNIIHLYNRFHQLHLGDEIKIVRGFRTRHYEDIIVGELSSYQLVLGNNTSNHWWLKKGNEKKMKKRVFWRWLQYSDYPMPLPFTYWDMLEIIKRNECAFAL